MQDYPEMIVKNYDFTDHFFVRVTSFLQNKLVFTFILPNNIIITMLNTICKFFIH